MCAIHPAMWSDDGVVRTKPSPSIRTALKAMEDMQKNPSAMAKHFLEHPSFSSEDIGMGQETEVARGATTETY